MDVEHIPYKGSMPALQDMMGGQTAWMFETFSTTLQLHKAGKVRILAYAYSKRAPIAPEIPTMIEAGVKGYEAYMFNLILGPANVPKPVVDVLDQASRQMMKDPATIKFLEDIAAVPTHEIARLRIAQSPEGRRIFPRMSVAENLQMGADATECSEAEREAGLERVFALFPRMKERIALGLAAFGGIGAHL